MDNWCTFTVVINSEGKLRTESWYMIAIPRICLKSVVAAGCLMTLNEILQLHYKVSRMFLLSLCNFASNERHLGINLVSRETVYLWWLFWKLHFTLRQLYCAWCFVHRLICAGILLHCVEKASISFLRLYFPVPRPQHKAGFCKASRRRRLL